jgi:hypothetical protein
MPFGPATAGLGLARRAGCGMSDHGETPEDLLRRHGATVVEPEGRATRSSGLLRPSLLPPSQTPLVMKPASLRLGPEIPPRPWIYGHRLVRGFVSTLVAPGGVGKTALALGIGMAVATGRPLLGEHVWVRGAVWVLNLEDAIDEVDRRIAAAMQQHGLTPSDLDGWLFTHSGRDREVVLIGHDESGTRIVYPDLAALLDTAQGQNLALIIVDPFVRSHRLDENSNVEIDQAVAAWSTVADRLGCAVLLLHHARKGPGVGDIEASRGAKALTDGARVGMVLVAMTEDEAKALGVEADDREALVRLVSAKANLAPRSQDTAWLKLESVALRNSNTVYTRGDDVQAVVTWSPPGVFDGFDLPRVHAVLDAIIAGHEPGVLFSKSRQGGSERWVGQVLMTVGGRGEAQAKEIIKQWLASGLLVETSFLHPRTRHSTPGVTVDNAKRPGKRP